MRARSWLLCPIVLLASLAAAGLARGQTGDKDDDRLAPIAGTVRDAADRPVAGATVWLVIRHYAAGRFDSVEWVSETQSGAGGEFAFSELSEKTLKGNVPYLIARDSQGRLGWSISYVRPGRSSIRLREVRDVRGRLVDGEGRPIAGAKITAQVFTVLAVGQRSTSDFTELFPELAAAFEVRTAADGGFVLPRAPVGARIGCDILAPGFGQPRAFFNTEQPVTIKLDRAGVISGALAPLAGVDAAKGGYTLRLTLLDEQPPPAGARAFTLTYRAELTTDDEGAFRSGEAPPGRYSIAPVAGQGRPFFAHPEQKVEVKPGETVEAVSMPLTPTVRLRGRVIERETGKGVENVELSAYQIVPRGQSRSAVDSQELTTNAQGEFEARLPPNETRVRVMRVPREFLVPADDYQNPTSREIADGDEWPTFELSRAAQVEGLVLDEAGRPAPGAELHIDLRRSSARLYDWLPSHSDANGKFKISQVDPAKKFSLRVRTADAVSDGLTPVTAAKLEGPVKVVVSEQHVFRLRGKVVNEAGQPVPKAEVSLNWERKVHSGHDLPAGLFEGAKRSPLEQFAAHDDGSFASGALWPEDKYRVTVSADGYATAETSEITGVAGTIHDFGTLALRRNDLAVSGLVVDEQGRAVAGAEVQVVLPARAFAAPLRADAEGRFSISPVDGSVPLALRARTAAAATDGAEVVLPADFARPVKLVVAARHAFRLRGTVIDRQDQPAPDANLSVVWDRRVAEPSSRSSADGRRLTPAGPATLDQFAAAADGAFETPALWPDEKYHLVASAPGHATVESEVVFGPAGEMTTLDPLVLARNDLKLEGRVVDAGGRPLEGATVLASGGAAEQCIATTAADGRFSLTGLYEGRAYILAQLNGYHAAGWRGAAGGGPIEIPLSGSDEPRRRVAMAKADDADRFAAERDLAGRLLANLWELRERFDDNPPKSRYQNGPRTDTVARLAEIMARLDLARALSWSAAEGARLDENVRIAAVEGDFKNDVDRALTLLAGIQTYGARTALLNMARREIAAGKREPAIRLLEAALAVSPDPGPIGNREFELATAQAQIGALAIKAGDEERGRKLLGQALEVAEKLAGGGSSATTRGHVAAALAASDPARALRLMDTVRETGVSNDHVHPAQAAAAVGAKDLDHARKFLGRIQPSVIAPSAIADRARERIAYQLAASDLGAALRLVDEIGPRNLQIKADALGWIARAIAKRDPAQAYALIDRALDLYLDGRATWRIQPEVARIALAAQAVGYPDMPSVIDRVLAVRPTAADERLPSRRVESTVAAARVLALVDRAIARELLLSIEPQARLIGPGKGDNARNGDVGRAEWLQAWALVDLDEAERRCAGELAQLRKQPRLAAAAIDLLPLLELLVVPSGERERFILHSVDKTYRAYAIDRTYWFPGDDEF